MPYDFEEISELLDSIVDRLLEACDVTQPPVQPRSLAKKLGIVYTEAQLEGRRGQSFRSRGRQYVEIHQSDRPERKSFALAHEIMEIELKKVMDNPGECHRWANLGASFLLMPTRWFREECLMTDFDIARLKSTFSSASWEVVSLRTLNFSESIVTIVDNGRISRRKSSYPYHVPRKLSEEEQNVLQKVLQTAGPERLHFPACAVAGYPVFEGEHRRVILRTTFDE
jgi:predicted transcriptional regulator